VRSSGTSTHTEGLKSIVVRESIQLQKAVNCVNIRCFFNYRHFRPWGLLKNKIW